MSFVRFALKLLTGAAALAALATIGLVVDLALNQRRVLYTLLGRDGLVAACLPPLTAKLREGGFEPDDVELGATPDITISTAAGRTLEDSFTFADGASETRVDGILACSIHGGTVTVQVQTTTTPTRAT